MSNFNKNKIVYGTHFPCNNPDFMVRKGRVANKRLSADGKTVAQYFLDTDGQYSWWYNSEHVFATKKEAIAFLREFLAQQMEILNKAEDKELLYKIYGEKK